MFQLYIYIYYIIIYINIKIYINDFSFRCENHKRQDGMMVRWYDGMSVMFQMSSNVKSSPPHDNNSTFKVAMLFIYITPSSKGIKVVLYSI